MNNSGYDKWLSKVKVAKPEFKDEKAMTDTIMKSIENKVQYCHRKEYGFYVKLVSGIAACLVSLMMITEMNRQNIKDDYAITGQSEKTSIKLKCKNDNIFEMYRCFLNENNIGIPDNIVKFKEKYKK